MFLILILKKDGFTEWAFLHELINLLNIFGVSKKVTFVVKLISPLVATCEDIGTDCQIPPPMKSVLKF